MNNSTAHLRAAFNCNPVGTLIVENESRRICDFNRSFLDLWKIPQTLADLGDDNLLIEHVLDQLVDPENFVSTIGELYRTPEKKSLDLLKFKDGRTVERSSEPCWAGGKVISRAWFFRDITDLVKMKDKIESEKREHLRRELFFKNILDSIPLLVARVNPEQKYTFVNKTYSDWLKKPQSEIIGKTLSEVLGPSNYSKVQGYVQKALQGENTEFEGTLFYAGCPKAVHGRYISNKKADGSGDGFHLVVSDVSYIKQLEEDAKVRTAQLLVSNERHSVTFSALHYGTFDYNALTNSVVWDDYMYSLFDTTRTEFSEPMECYRDRMAEGEFERARLDSEQAVANKVPEYNFTYKVKTPRAVKYITFCARCFYDDSGKLERLVGASWDVTEKILRTQALESSQKLLRQIIDSTPDWIFVKDVNHRFLLANKALADAFGLKPSDMIGKSDLELGNSEETVKGNPQKGVEGFWSADDYVFKTGETKIIADDPAMVGGKMLHLHTVKTPIHDENNKIYGVLGLSRDLTPMREKDQLVAEQQTKLLAASKMSSLGEMAGGIAHEINTPLAIIVGLANRIKIFTAKGDFDPQKVSSDLMKVEQTALRIGKIIKGLKSFSRNSDGDPMENVTLSQIVEDTLALCQERFKSHDIELRIQIVDELTLRCRATQISQVLMNLIGNAFDAVSDLPEKWVKVESVIAGEFLAISVTDSGKGIRPEVVAKMMNPFFTTKEVGKGTGLGLSISRSIIEDHKGSLLYDDSSANTRFVLKLPFTQSKIGSKAA